MLSQLEIENFRCFRHHSLELKPTTLVVGRNNAGKSTIIEALRLVAIVENRYKALNFENVPPWLDIPMRKRGVRPSLAGYEINLDTVFHRYGDPPARIAAQFSTGEQIEVYVGPAGALHGVISDASGQVVSTKGQARHVSLPDVAILPQVGPLLKHETQLNEEYVRRNLTSSVASLHFRNQLVLLSEHFPRFKAMAEGTWPSLRLSELIDGSDTQNHELSLLLRDRDFVADVGLMGHGLQMWLQVIWFLARTNSQTTIILDEPDVYMHPDLQHRLLRLLKGQYKQTIIATHSVEMLSEVQPDEILIIERDRPQSRYAGTFEAVQRVVDHIGGYNNLQLTRLWSARKLILLEGDDMSILNRLHGTLFPAADASLQTIPHFAIGGWNGWPNAIGTSLITQNALGEGLMAYCLLDSDYHPPAEQAERLIQAAARGIQLHIWDRKEIENYLIVPEAIARLINATRLPRRYLGSDEVIAKIECFAASQKAAIVASFTDEFFRRSKEKGAGYAGRAANEHVERAWADLDGRLRLLPGKSALAYIFNWAKSEFNVSLSIDRLCAAIRGEELHDEMRSILSSIQNGQAF